MGKRKLIHFDRSQAGKLHCDACGYDLPHVQAFTPALVGTECPACLENMLTQEDYDKTDRMFRLLDWINKWFGWLGATREVAEEKGQTLSVKIHGDDIHIRTESKG